MPRPRLPARVRMHHTVHTGRSSTCGILLLARAKLFRSARGATPAQPTGTSPS